MDPFEILGVPSSATLDEIRVAYKRLVRRFHPDLHAQESEAVRAYAQRQMADVNHAYQVLTDPRVRARHERAERRRAGSRPTYEPPPRPSSTSDRHDRHVRTDRRRPPDPDPDFDYRERARSEFSYRRDATTGFDSWSSKGSSEPPRRGYDDVLATEREFARRRAQRLTPTQRARFAGWVALRRLRAWLRGR